MMFRSHRTLPECFERYNIRFSVVIVQQNRTRGIYQERQERSPRFDPIMVFGIYGVQPSNRRPPGARYNNIY